MHDAAQLIDRLSVTTSTCVCARRLESELDPAAIRLRRGAAWRAEGDDSRRRQTVRDLGDLEFVARQDGGDVPEIALTIDHRQGSPLVRQQIEHRALAAGVDRRELWNHGEIRNDVGNA
jgi:hypothetical protein